MLRLFEDAAGSQFRTMPPNVSTSVPSLSSKALSDTNQSVRSRDALLIGLGLGLSTSLYVGVLGLRWPVILTGLLPPAAVMVVWQQGQRRQRRPLPAPPTTLLDASLLRERLQLDVELPPAIRYQWRMVSERLEALRALAVHCTELDPGCALPLLVLLERLVDQATGVRGDLRRLNQAPTEGSKRLYQQRLEALQQQLQACQDGLGRNYDAALEDALRCPDVPAKVLLSPSLLQS